MQGYHGVLLKALNEQTQYHSCDYLSLFCMYMVDVEDQETVVNCFMSCFDCKENMYVMFETMLLSLCKQNCHHLYTVIILFMWVLYLFKLICLISNVCIQKGRKFTEL